MTFKSNADCTLYLHVTLQYNRGMTAHLLTLTFLQCILVILAAHALFCQVHHSLRSDLHSTVYCMIWDKQKVMLSGKEHFTIFSAQLVHSLKETFSCPVHAALPLRRIQLQPECSIKTVQTPLGLIDRASLCWKHFLCIL